MRLLRTFFKPVTLFAIFIPLFGLNIFLVKYIHAETRRDSKISVILQEFDTIRASDMFADLDAVSSSDSAYTDDQKDNRIAILKAFFRTHDSPLYDHAAFIVKTSDANSLDYRLIPAISMQESGACRVIPPGSHNCWGWGIYGNTVTRFDSYPQAINAVATGLKKYYIDKGLRTPEDIMRKYNPSSNGSWAFGVNTFIDVLQ